MLSDSLPTPGFFTTAIQADENMNPFEDSFKQGRSAFERNKETVGSESGDKEWPRPIFDDNTLSTSVGEEDYGSLFGFSPRRGRSPVPNNDSVQKIRRDSQIDLANGIGATSPSMWNMVKSEDRFGFGQQPNINTQELSPPNSSDNSPVEWTYENFQPMCSPLHSMLTEIHPTDTRSRYGQITPPIDLPSGLMMVDGNFDYGQSLTPQSNFQQPSADPATNVVDSTLKRKRVEQSVEPKNGSGNKASTNKRQRKSKPRSKPDLTNSKGSAHPQEDVKRSKFLERNRVAASKCRQKKKEWTSNLEARARDLQNSKNQLAIMVSSLKDEMLFLKGELLKHSGCTCTRIRDYLDHEVTNLAHPTSTQQPRLESPPISSCGRQDSGVPSTSDDFADTSMGSSGSANGSRRGSWDDDRTDDDLHALLSAQLERPTDAETEDQETKAVCS